MEHSLSYVTDEQRRLTKIEALKGVAYLVCVALVSKYSLMIRSETVSVVETGYLLSVPIHAAYSRFVARPVLSLLGASTGLHSDVCMRHVFPLRSGLFVELSWS